MLHPGTNFLSFMLTSVGPTMLRELDSFEGNEAMVSVQVVVSSASGGSPLGPGGDEAAVSCNDISTVSG